MADTLQVSKAVPIIADVDVLVVGGGISGVAAALAAARNGARTMLVERYGYLGGNMGPGMFSGGVLHLVLRFPDVLRDGLKGIAGEIVDRCEGYCDGQLGHEYFRDSQAVAYVSFKLMDESGVHLLLNTFAGDPIMDGNHVVGLLVENKSGTQAIRAQVVVDATGDADVAARAGAPVEHAPDRAHPGMYFAMGDVNIARLLAYVREHAEPDPDDLHWAQELFTRELGRHVPALNPVIPLFRRAWDKGAYRIVKRIGDLASVTIDHGILHPPFDLTPSRYRREFGIVGAQVGLYGKSIYTGDAAIMTELEVGARIYIFETAQWLHRQVPGYEDAYLHMIAPYFHARNGRSAVCDYTVTLDDVRADRRHDDVIFVSWASEANVGSAVGYDFPYRQLLPKGIEGLLVTGRSAIIQPPSNRNRWKMLVMGQAAGLAAALAAASRVAPRALDVKALQKVLHLKYQAPLGDATRLEELGIA